MNQHAPLLFAVNGTPKPQPRPRFVKGKVVSTADKKTAIWKEHVKRAAMKALADAGRLPLQGAVAVEIEFRFIPIPAKRDRIGQPHTQKPDADNVAKLVMDAMTAAKIFGDDCQVSTLTTRKMWSERAGCVVSVAIAPAGSPESRQEEFFDVQTPPSWL